MNSSDIQKKDQQFVAHTYKRFPASLIEGKGARAYDPEGKAYIDFTSGIGVNCLGYADEGWADAVSSQAHKLQHVSNLYYTEPCALLGEKICSYAGYSRVFFGNSGAEANECAVKIARKRGIEKHGEKCNTIITMNNSFHGRTITTLSATGQDVFHQHFFPFTEGFRHVDIDSLEELEKALDETVCAIMIELIQGEGGVIPVSKEFVKGIENICKEKELTFIVDEIQTGIGRTGTLLCSQQYDIHPDVVTLAKSLGGGLPIGAALMSDTVDEVLGYGDHGSTFGGNPVSCAGGMYVLDKVMEDGFLEEVRKKGAYLKERLEKIPQIEGVTGLGLMLGAALKDGMTSAEAAGKCVEKGLLVLTAKTKLRFLPPLNITMEEMDEGIRILEEVLGQMQ